jgi:hypothetical protein
MVRAKNIPRWPNEHNISQQLWRCCLYICTFGSFLCAFMFIYAIYWIIPQAPVNSKIASMSWVHKHIFQLWSRHAHSETQPAAKSNRTQLKDFLWTNVRLPPQMSWDILIAVTKTFQVILIHKFLTSSFIFEQDEARHFAVVCLYTYECHLSLDRAHLVVFWSDIF